jgi:anaerobic ribonucleoside-triphosphate reductase activating protein
MPHDTRPVTLNVAAWEERSVVNGPGERFVLWVQGCPFRCPGCFNPDYLPFVEARRITVEQVAGVIRGVRGLEGVTYSGGEPMAQAEGLYHLSRLVKDDGLTVVCYSGYTLEELRALPGPWVGRLLDVTDVLIDGRYDRARAAPLPWRGSANQRVHFLTPAYRHLEARAAEPGGEVELIVGKEALVTTGVFDVAFLRRLEEVLRGEAP